MTEFKKATFGAGCFWCVEAIFQDLKGVHSVRSGYTNGVTHNPRYEDVCSGTTGHVEVVQITFDPAVISFEDLLYVFWRTHDPTSLNKQGNDAGTQYRSGIYYNSKEQRKVAEQSLAETQASGLWPNKIVTEIEALQHFHEAEGYHQSYYKLNPQEPYCIFVIDPKMSVFKDEFKTLLKDSVSV